MTGSPAAPPIVDVSGLSKRFGAVQALDRVSVRFEAGRFHALLGENGAGKSTLVKCLLGYHRADAGTISVDGAEVEIRDTHDAHALGFGMVYQHFTLVDQMTVAENLVLARADIPPVIDWRFERRAIEDFMRAAPFRLDPDRPASSLAAGEKQKLEIIKQLYLGRNFVVLDEPTSVLTPQEADEVLGRIRAMTDEARLTAVLITHKFREVMQFGQDVTVLREGRVVGSRAIGDTEQRELAELMFGGEVERPGGPRRGSARGATPYLEVSHMSARSDRGTTAVANVSFAVRPGEILGICGVSGNGQKQLVEVLAGQRLALDGSIRVAGEPYRRDRRAMHRHGVFVLTEEPLRNACVRSFSVAENLALRSFDRAPVARWGVMRRGVMRRMAERLIDEYRIRTWSPAARIDTLSGGNVQRVVLARELSRDVRLLIAQNPCFGLDAAAAADIRLRMLAARDLGAAILLISEDLDEVMELSDRIMVMLTGRLVHECERAAADRYRIGRYMAGETGGAAA